MHLRWSLSALSLVRIACFAECPKSFFNREFAFNLVLIMICGDRLTRQIGRRRLLHFFRFEPTDRRPEPGAERFLKFLLCPGAVQRRDSLSGRQQWDMNAWNLFRARVLWDELHQEAFAAGFTVLVLGAKVHASGGILENKPWPPSLAR